MTRAAIYGSGRTAAALIPASHAAGHEIVAGVAHRAENAGADLGELTIGRSLGIPLAAGLDALLARDDVDVLHYAGITGPVFVDVLERCASAALHVVTASMIHPPTALGADVAARIDTLARASGARIVGTGVNPGFYLDVLPAALALTLPDPLRVHARRISDIGRWGADVLRAEVGVGRAPRDAPQTFAITLAESVHVLAGAAGVPLDRVELVHDPVVAMRPGTVGTLPVEPGQVEGINHGARGVGHDGATAIELVWCGIADPAARGLTPGIDLHLSGGGELEVTAHLEVPADPYPSTAVRMVTAAASLHLLPTGLHGPEVVPLRRACVAGPSGPRGSCPDAVAPDAGAA